MGLYDDILVNLPLGDYKAGTEWQSKSLSCGMDKYEITADGSLYKVKEYMRDVKRHLYPYTGPLEVHDWNPVEKRMESFTFSFKEGIMQGVIDTSSGPLPE